MKIEKHGAPLGFRQRPRQGDRRERAPGRIGSVGERDDHPLPPFIDIRAPIAVSERSTSVSISGASVGSLGIMRRMPRSSPSVHARRRLRRSAGTYAGRTTTASAA